MENHCFATLPALEKRAEILRQIREFFYVRGVLELETPILAPAASVDLHLDSFETAFVQGESKTPLYLQTSPEFHMKRFLSKHKRDCYQITKAFRNGEMGRRHNPEFSILEWYRVGKNYHELMDDVAALVTAVTGRKNFQKRRYADVFAEECGVDIFTISLAGLQERTRRAAPTIEIETIDEGLDVLLTHEIEPTLAAQGNVFVYDYPASQAALAKLSPSDSRVARRFELYLDGVEICNGFEELADAAEQEARFRAELAEREKMGKTSYPYDRKLIDALAEGFPECSGVAVGLDRLVMIALGKENLNEIMAFTYENA